MKPQASERNILRVLEQRKVTCWSNHSSKNINYQAKQVNQLSSKTRYMKDYGNTNMIANGLTQCQIVNLRSVQYIRNR